MAIQIASQPDKWSSAYRPIEFVFGSDRYPNTTLGDVNVPILFIQENTVGVFATISAQFLTSDLQAGETIFIDNTDAGLYQGNYKVRSAFESSGVLIAYLDTAYVGDDTGGTASRVLDNFRLMAEVVFDGSGNTVEFELLPNEDDEFILNMQDCASAQFRRLFDVVEPGLAFGTLRNCDTSIAQAYTVNVWEQHTLWTSGVPSTTTNRKDTEQKLKGFRVVNAVHPYHKSEDFDMDWDSDMGDLFPIGEGQPQRRFLTWADRATQEVEAGDDFFVSFLVNKIAESGWQLIATSFYEGVAFGIQTQVLGSFPQYAATINVGPSVLTALSGADSYTIRLLDRNGVQISETLTIKYVCKSAEVSKRVYWLNKLGGLDQYTMKGREMDIPNVGRESISRIHNPIPTPRYQGGWNERGSRVDAERAKLLTSENINVATLRWLAEDCFESHDHATQVRAGWWTPMVVTGTQSTPFGTDNQNGRFLLEYHYGVDNLSQRG